MVPRVSKPGRSFAGAALYYLHDKDAETSRRVEFTHVENIGTQDPEYAMRWMAFSAKAANEEKDRTRAPGRRIEKSVWTVSLSWQEDEQLNREEMIAAGRSWLTMRGLQDHQVVMVSHNDEAYPHIHLIINLVNPQTLKLNKDAVSHAKLQSSRWAEDYERERGKIHCAQRVENNARRKRGEFVKYRESDEKFKERITQLYRSADSGRAFVAALKQQGYDLVQGKRLLVIDRDGNTRSLYRQIDGASAKDIKAKLADANLRTISGGRDQDDGDARRQASRKRRDQRNAARAQEADDRKLDEAQAQDAARDREKQQTRRPPPFSRRHAREEIYFDRDGQERQQQDRTERAGIKQQKDDVLTGLLNRLQDAHLAQWGRFYEESHQQRQREEAKLENQYGADERRLRSSIGEREKAIRDSSHIKSWFLKNFTRETERLENERLTLAGIEQRKAERRGALDLDIETQRRALEELQTKERRGLPDDLTPQRLDPLARSIEEQQREAAARDKAHEEPGRTDINHDGTDIGRRPADDVLDASIREQQDAQGNAYLGAAAPSDTAAQPQDAAPAAAATETTSYDGASGDIGREYEREGPSLGGQGEVG